MAKNKLRKWDQMAALPHVHQAGGKDWITTDFHLKGKWHAEVFKNQNPIVIELGCGKGEYTVGLAGMFPDKNFIGVDIKGARMWNGAQESFDKKMNNVAFLRTRIDFITAFFAPGEVSEIWLTFSDPQPKKEKKRLTSSLFVERYRKILADNAIIHVKTDSDLLYEFTLDEIEKRGYTLLTKVPDLYNEKKMDPFLQSILHIRTYYEGIWLAKGISIKYLRFSV